MFLFIKIQLEVDKEIIIEIIWIYLIRLTAIRSFSSIESVFKFTLSMITQVLNFAG
jgi:hypothetical protein